MKIICDGRQCGKTTKMLEWTNNQKGYNLIVCSDLREVQRLWKIILEKKYDLPQPITFNDFIKRNYCGRNIKNIVIDNVDLLLKTMCTTKLGCITLTQGNPYKDIKGTFDEKMSQAIDIYSKEWDLEYKAKFEEESEEKNGM